MNKTTWLFKTKPHHQMFYIKKKSSDHNYNIYKDELKYSSQNVK